MQRLIPLLFLMCACGRTAPTVHSGSAPQPSQPGSAQSAEPAQVVEAATLIDRHGDKLSVSHNGDTPASLRPWVPVVEAAVGKSVSAPTVTLDAALHRRLETAFARIERGAGVVIDIDGGIRALYSTLPHHGEEGLVVRHLATGRPIPCGSSAKPFTAVAAFAANVLTSETRHVCSGSINVGARRFHCFGQHGELDVARALAISDNIFFFHLALEMKHDQIASVQRAFGLGVTTALLPKAPPGFVPMQDVLDADGKTLRVAQTLSQSIGHAIRVTPLQMARAYAALASGELPKLTFSPRVGGGVPLTEGWRASLPLIRDALRGVVTDSEGTAHFASVAAQPNLAGKTGTAETVHAVGEPSHRLGWFAGWAPANDPRIAFAFRVEDMSGRQVAEVVMPTIDALVASDGPLAGSGTAAVR